MLGNNEVAKIKVNYNVPAHNFACYWKNGIRTDLSIERSFATSIFVDKSDIYVAGVVFYEDSRQIACYWKNNTRIDIAKNIGGHANAMFVVN